MFSISNLLYQVVVFPSILHPKFCIGWIQPKAALLPGSRYPGDSETMVGIEVTVILVPSEKIQRATMRDSNSGGSMAVIVTSTNGDTLSSVLTTLFDGHSKIVALEWL